MPRSIEATGIVQSVRVERKNEKRVLAQLSKSAAHFIVNIPFARGSIMRHAFARPVKDRHIEIVSFKLIIKEIKRFRHKKPAILVEFINRENERTAAPRDNDLIKVIGYIDSYRNVIIAEKAESLISGEIIWRIQ